MAKDDTGLKPFPKRTGELRVKTAEQVPTNQWIHVAFVYDGSSRADGLQIWLDGQPQLVPNALGDYLTPSVVGLDDDGSVLVGLAAKERLHTHPDVTAASFKRFMGTERQIWLGGRSFRPEELSSLLLRALKEDAEAFLSRAKSSGSRARPGRESRTHLAP